MQKKDKQKVIGAALQEESVAAFLNCRPYGEENVDFHILTKAYRGLPANEFERFITLYKAAGHDLNPQDTDGNHFLDTISVNTRQQAYVDILKRASC
ncbi:MAG: hypothetical protein CSA49_05255 [Gammaproteobacteria bacterium]|nr:MAG: hypothetical protein CSA49_05255 [Gammaproteobacteria bacterium]